MTRSIFALLIVLAVPAFGKTTATSPASKFPSMTLEFDEGKSTLTPAMHDKLKSFIGEVGPTSNIDDVYVAAWSDNLRPKDNDLSDEDQKLAKRRAEEVKKFLEDTYKVDVDTFNMAKRSDLWSRTFDTEEARIKGNAPAGGDTVAQRIQAAAKVGSVVVVVEPKNHDRVTR